MGFFMYFAWVQFPVTAVLLALLMLPVWGAILPIVQLRRMVIRFVDSVFMFTMPIAGFAVNFFWFLFLMSFATFVASTMQMSKCHEDYHKMKEMGAKNDYIVTEKFKSERNWWLSLFGLCLWLIIVQVRAFLKNIAALEDRVVQLENEKKSLTKGDFTGVSSSSNSNSTGGRVIATAPVIDNATDSAPASGKTKKSQ